MPFFHVAKRRPQDVDCYHGTPFLEAFIAMAAVCQIRVDG
jgi:hypothetical protein